MLRTSPEESSVIIDVDTLKVRNNHHADRIRLSGIDCPEKGQVYGLFTITC